MKVTERSRPDTQLTPREFEILGIIAEGLSSQEAADRIFVSKRTIDFHLSCIFRKLEVHNRVQACRAAERQRAHLTTIGDQAT